jgi:hypothetical protein
MRFSRQRAIWLGSAVMLASVIAVFAFQRDGHLEIGWTLGLFTFGWIIVAIAVTAPKSSR